MIQIRHHSKWHDGKHLFTIECNGSFTPLKSNTRIMKKSCLVNSMGKF